ncbi:MAG TPA: hypothetical protein VL171_00835 [Verrucomicrobiae bacterium]|nr:hypothetical protein [Verrucomicrobiae bacterium]
MPQQSRKTNHAGRVRQLENCLLDLQRWVRDRLTEANEHGADDPRENPEIKELERLHRGVNRTLPL